jgi:nucleotide-binding universal stress UspA family protein
MFERLLLPLDGSELAEAVIPFTRELAGRMGSEVHLLHVCPPEHDYYGHMHRTYLEHIADTMRQSLDKDWPGKITVTTEVVVGEPVKAIYDNIQENGISMVALTTCGSSGIKAWVLGSVAERVVRGANVPTLLVRVRGGMVTPGPQRPIRRILLPLDGSDASKIAVPYARELAKKLDAGITLFRMAETVYAQSVDGMTAGIGVNWDEIDAQTQKFVNTEMEKIEEDLRNSGLSVSHAVTIGIDAAQEILEQEKKSNADLVVMATRGRSPIARWAFGSVAEKVLQEGELPLLAVREGVS